MAESKFPVSIVVNAVDNVSYKLIEINQKLEKITKPLGKLKTAFGDLGRESGLSKLGGALSNVGSKGSAFFKELGSAALKVAGIMATVGTAFKFLVKDAANSGDEILDASKRLGISAKAFQEFQFAASQSGIELENVEGILSKFSKNIGEASTGAGEAVGIFRGLGVKLKDAKGQTRGMTELLPELADKFKQIKDPALRNAVAVKLFGREGIKMNEVLLGGSEGLKKFADEANRLGLVLGDDQLKSADEFNDSWSKLMLTFSRTRDQIGAQLFPVFIELFENLSNMINENRPQIIAFAQAFAKDLPGILTTIKDLIVGLWGAVQPLIGAFRFLSSIFGTTNTVLGIMGTIIGGKLLISFASFVGSLINLGGTVLPILIRGFVLFAPYLTILARGFAAIFLANPLGLFITLATIGYTLYKNWEPFAKLIDGIGSKIASVAGAVGKFTGLSGLFGGAASTTPQGSPLGGAKTAQAANSQLLNRTENQISVNFENVPKGIRVSQDKAEAPIDLSMGYSMVGGM